MTGIKIATIGGGSSYTPELIEDLLNVMMSFLFVKFG